MRKILAAVLLFLAAAVFLYYYERPGEMFAPSGEGDRLKVATSFYVLGEFAKQVGEENIEAHVVAPAGVEPHEYEPSPRDVALVYSADIFIFQGGGFDPWAGRIAGDLRSKGVFVVAISDGLGFKDGDPHVWLDPVLAQKMIEIIRDAFIRVDAARAMAYRENSAGYIEKLSELVGEFSRGLADCRLKKAVVSHSAFRYLGERYGLSFVPVSGISPEQEPSLRQVADIVKMMRGENIKYVLAEPLGGSKAAQAVAREAGAGMLVLDPIEGLSETNEKSGEDYLSLMRKNLESLRAALSCKGNPTSAR